MYILFVQVGHFGEPMEQSFETARLTASNFCEARDWGNFHTPTNLVLALSGEVGELIEVFQWKGYFGVGDLPKKKSVLFSEKELINIGEEIADVWIYSTRLCDVCEIDLACSVRSYLQEEGSKNIKYRNYEKKKIDANITTGSWSNLSFEEMDRILTQVVASPKIENSYLRLGEGLLVTGASAPSTPLSNDNSYSMLSDRSHGGEMQQFYYGYGIVPASSLGLLSQSPRSLVMGVQKNVGCITSLFLSKQEVDCKHGLPNFTCSEVSELALATASIVCLLTLLAKAFDLHIGKCLSEKFAKNSQKYPAEKVKGSSKKYTEYTNENSNSKLSASSSSSSSSPISPDKKNIALLIGMGALGSFLGFLIGKAMKKN